MSKISIRYSSISAAKSEAKSVARKLDSYHSSLNSSVYRKLSNYSGPSSSNISNAKRSINKKLNAIDVAKTAYNNYANALSDLTDSCKQVDKRVKQNVERLTTQFKARNGIKNSWIENTISGIVSYFENKTPLGRWFSSIRDLAHSMMDRLKDAIKAWFNFDGGKDFVKGALVAVLEVAIGVCGVIAGIAALIAAGTVGAFIVAIAAVVGAVIATVNGVINLVNESRGISVAGDDPALAKRLHGENSFQDTVRCEALKNVKNWYTASKVVTTVTVVCAVINIISEGTKLLSKGIKWSSNLGDLKMKDYFSAKNYKNLFGKLFDTAKSGFKNFGSAFKGTDGISLQSVIAGLGSEMSKGIKVFKSDFIQHFRTVFAKGNVATIKEFAGIAKALVSAENMGDLIFGGFEKLVLPSLVFIHEPTFSTESSGQIKLEFDWLTGKDVYSLPTDLMKKIIKPITKPTFNHEIPADLVSKLNNIGNIDIKIPAIDMPTLSFKEVVSFRSFSPMPAH